MKKYYMLPILIGSLLISTLTAEEMLSAETYASYYGEAFNGKPTSSGEIFDMNAYTAAHKTLPFGTLLEVTNLENGKKVVVRVNDRGPFIANREIDLSKAAAVSLGMVSKGITRVSIKKVDSLDHAALVAANEVYSEKEKAMRSQEKKASAPAIKPAGESPERKESAEMALLASAADTRRDYEPQQEPEAENVSSDETASPSSEILWRIQLGAFAREENALRLVVRLRKAGLEPAYERTENSVRVVLPGIRTSELDKVKEALAAGSFNDYVIRQESW